MWQYPTYVSQIKWLIHKENLSHSRSHSEAECWLDCKHPFNGWTPCNHGHFKQIFFGVWAQIFRQDEKILVPSGVGLGSESWVWAPGPCPHLPGDPCSSTPAHRAQGGSLGGRSAKVRCEVFGLFMAEILEKMKKNILPVFLEENFLMFQIYFSHFF